MIFDAESIIEELEKRYPNDALKVDELKSEKDKMEYTGKLKLIREIKTIVKRKKEGGE